MHFLVKSITTTFFLLVYPTIVVAQDLSAALACATLPEAKTRLICYDAIFSEGRIRPPVASTDESETKPQPNPATSMPIVTADKGKWLVAVDKSALTDDQNVYLSLTSENNVVDRFGNAGKGRLLIRCQENTTAVTFAFNDQFMASIQGYGKIEYRLDEAKMRVIHARESTDNMVLGLWSGRKAIPFVKGLLGHKRLVVRATPYNGSTYMLTYEISGIDSVIGQLRKTCNW